jgi:ribosomal protein S18 acetylase RimI-like enzyme
MDLRRATDADVEALTALADAAYAVYVPRMGRPPGPKVADYAAAVREAETWVLAGPEGVLGLLVLYPEDDHLLLENVAVRPGEQGRGLGRRLLEHAERRAIAHGLPEVRLYTHETMVENQAMYVRHGYVETDRRGDDGLRRVFYTKDLRGRS